MINNIKTFNINKKPYFKAFERDVPVCPHTGCLITNNQMNRYEITGAVLRAPLGNGRELVEIEPITLGDIEPAVFACSQKLGLRPKYRPDIKPLPDPVGNIV